MPMSSFAPSYARSKTFVADTELTTRGGSRELISSAVAGSTWNSESVPLARGGVKRL